MCLKSFVTFNQAKQEHMLHRQQDKSPTFTVTVNISLLIYSLSLILLHLLKYFHRVNIKRYTKEEKIKQVVT